MGGIRPIMMQSILLLCYFLLYPVEAILQETPTKVPQHLPSLESQLPSSDFMLCQSLLPKSLPGFTNMGLLPRFLVGLALRNALEKAGCQDYAWTVERELYRLGGVKATQLLIHHLHELLKDRRTQKEASADVQPFALQLLARELPGPERTRRSFQTADCEQKQEQNVHRVLRLLPTVGTFYNLGTALYYASQNCLDTAKNRGQDGAIDLGYDLLMTMAGLSGTPTGLLISSALKPAVKAGIEQLIQNYFEKETNISLLETNEKVNSTDVRDLEETNAVSAVSKLGSSIFSKWWVPLKTHYSDPEPESRML
ncbi:PREDICTED: apolipoprotein F-like [Elephantulus edwardii]|uniref:apolipoprotein F-like n=1 Tax=Elephantulus edwardii TaxID=28737 RepID=UPI0003F0C0CD|nr:PREDICTED: apolipoprotein F-like [Elephantulus edwardii]